MRYFIEIFRFDTVRFAFSVGSTLYVFSISTIVLSPFRHCTLGSTLYSSRFDTVRSARHCTVTLERFSISTLYPPSEPRASPFRHNVTVSNQFPLYFVFISYGTRKGFLRVHVDLLINTSSSCLAIASS